MGPNPLPPNVYVTTRFLCVAFLFFNRSFSAFFVSPKSKNDRLDSDVLVLSSEFQPANWGTVIAHACLSSGPFSVTSSPQFVTIHKELGVSSNYYSFSPRGETKEAKSEAKQTVRKQSVVWSSIVLETEISVEKTEIRVHTQCSAPDYSLSNEVSERRQTATNGKWKVENSRVTTKKATTHADEGLNVNLDDLSFLRIREQNNSLLRSQFHVIGTVRGWISSLGWSGVELVCGVRNSHTRGFVTRSLKSIPPPLVSIWSVTRPSVTRGGFTSIDQGHILDLTEQQSARNDKWVSVCVRVCVWMVTGTTPFSFLSEGWNWMFTSVLVLVHAGFFSATLYFLRRPRVSHVNLYRWVQMVWRVQWRSLLAAEEFWAFVVTAWVGWFRLTAWKSPQKLLWKKTQWIFHCRKILHIMFKTHIQWKSWIIFKLPKTRRLLVHVLLLWTDLRHFSLSHWVNDLSRKQICVQKPSCRLWLGNQVKGGVLWTCRVCGSWVVFALGFWWPIRCGNWSAIRVLILQNDDFSSAGPRVSLATPFWIAIVRVLKRDRFLTRFSSSRSSQRAKTDGQTDRHTHTQGVQRPTLSYYFMLILLCPTFWDFSAGLIKSWAEVGLLK